MCAAKAQPVVVFSGWPPEEMLTAVRRLRQQASCMAAMAVPRAMPKKMKQLLEEMLGEAMRSLKVPRIEADFELNQASKDSKSCAHGECFGV